MMLRLSALLMATLLAACSDASTHGRAMPSAREARGLSSWQSEARDRMYQVDHGRTDEHERSG